MHSPRPGNLGNSDGGVSDDGEGGVSDDGEGGVEDDVLEIFEGRPISTSRHEVAARKVRKVLPVYSTANKQKAAFPEMLVRPMQDAKNRTEHRLPDARGFLKGEKGVRYLDREARKRYEVKMGARIRYAIDDIVFDTASIRENAKKTEGTFGKTWILSMANWGKPYGATGAKVRKEDGTFAAGREWRTTSLIWVIAPDKLEKRPRFYSHVCKGGKLHHSSFNEGKSVLGAGEWIVEAGKLLKISANSGHYRPDLSLFTQSVRLMAEAHNPDTMVTMYDRTTDTWVDRGIKEFLDKPAGDGRYKVHPQS